ncbi:hypothetical protein [Mucilaginibacter gilvus]|uniref:DUF5640 domain-containing protein n=1 Tax=Mucilaginibacter gilvus TaxID=2305909 RepID=A0A3S3VB08_9SPHI|nr:hypothetical protein [Mucilaginibacter gilvus]RWY49496.1 hypothetical protein EPL05_19020 [Mucilaginibacter gilvus]
MTRALLLIATVCFLSACTKTDVLDGSIFGKYELRATYGGFSYHYDKFSPGNGSIFQFKSDSTYNRYAGDAIAASGKYHIKITNTEGGVRYGTIAFNTSDYREAFRIKGDTITIGTTVTDGIASEYVKLK